MVTTLKILVYVDNMHNWQVRRNCTLKHKPFLRTLGQTSHRGRVTSLVKRYTYVQIWTIRDKIRSQFSHKIIHWKQNLKWAELLVHCSTSIFHEDTFLRRWNICIVMKPLMVKIRTWTKMILITPKIILTLIHSMKTTFTYHYINNAKFIDVIM